MRARCFTTFVLLVLGCGSPSVAAMDGGATGSEDAATPSADSGPPIDAGMIGADGGPLPDAGTSPELCTGGLDEDGDTAIDCVDPDCFGFADCVAADVAHMVPGLTLCGDLIEIDEAASRDACTMIGTPMLSMVPADCATGSLTATARVFCDASGAPAALWMEERLTAPETHEMLSARQFRQTYYERASVIDWERQASGVSAREGGSGFPIHETQANGTTGGSTFTVVTVRSALAGDAISRLLGMQFITSLIDLDSPMSMDTRSSVYLGGLALTVPAP